MKHVMVDLETLALGPFPVVVAIGAIKFDPVVGVSETYVLGDHCFFCPIDVGSCKDLGADITADTTRWWMKPDKNAVRPLVFAENPWHVAEALYSFVTWCDGAEFVWSHGLTFDVNILINYFHALDQLWPFNYRAGRDTRTLFDLVSPDNPTQQNPELEHHPTYDSWFQAYRVSSCYRKIGRTA